MYNFKFELGDRVKDVITGYSGCVMGRIQFLTGCNQYAIGPTKLDKDGKRVDWEYLDENRLVISGKPIKLPGQNKKSKKSDDDARGFDGQHPEKN